jgi:type II secretion system protein I
MRTNPAGFTLLEVLIALVVIAIGMLALVGSTAVLVRQTAEIGARAAAVRAAANRLQRLGIATCAPASGNQTGAHGIHERWAIDVQPDGVRELRDSVTYMTPSGERSVILRTKLPC